jgi:hypothetical protein
MTGLGVKDKKNWILFIEKIETLCFFLLVTMYEGFLVDFPMLVLKIDFLSKLAGVITGRPQIKCSQPLRMTGFATS